MASDTLKTIQSILEGADSDPYKGRVTSKPSDSFVNNDVIGDKTRDVQFSNSLAASASGQTVNNPYKGVVTSKQPGSVDTVSTGDKLGGVKYTNKQAAAPSNDAIQSPNPNSPNSSIKAPGAAALFDKSKNTKKAKFPTPAESGKDLSMKSDIAPKGGKVSQNSEDEEVDETAEELGTESNVSDTDEVANEAATDEAEPKDAPKKNFKSDFAARMAALRAKKKGASAKVDTDDKEKDNSKMTANVKADKTTNKETNEHVEALFNGEDLSEDFKTKAKTIFESALNTREAELRDQLAEDCVDVLTEEVEAIRAELTEQLDNYMDYIAGNWLEENKLQVENGLKVEITESFMTGLRNLFLEHDIDVPETKANLVDELAAKANDLEEQLSREMNVNIELTQKLEEYAKNEAIAELGEGLADTQFDKFVSLCEDISYDNDAEFKNKAKIIKENYFLNIKTNSKPVKTIISEDTLVADGTSSVDDVQTEVPVEMKAVSEILNRLGRK